MPGHLKIDVISLFPDMFKVLDQGITGRAKKQNYYSLDILNPRDFTRDKHKTVDDKPYGGGPGMLMKYQPLKEALDTVVNSGKTYRSEKVIYLSPQGRQLKHADVKRLSQIEHIVLLCGRYEGIDERLIDCCVDEEWSIGDYVLSGGELAAMTLIDAMVRLIPGALGDDDSAVNDSFYHGLLDYPHYTRPDSVDGKNVPPVLKSGNHKKIEQWRMYQSLERTWKRRPDLLKNIELNEEQKQMLNQIIEKNELINE
ncbi:MAG: tRNA (guanosine(37)-N1)-methyltransferase TrmD [Pseudomonadota bacterium]